MTGCFLSHKCAHALLNLQRKVPPVPQIPGSAPEMGRLVLVII